MKVLVGCEFSGIVREEFKKLGWDSWSCDLLKTEIPSKKHLMKDIKQVDLSVFDLLIVHPPCTYLSNSGARWHAIKKKEQEDAVDFVRYFLCAQVKHIAIENPVGVLSTIIGPPTQIVQPWWFGVDQNKRTCLWLHNLPKLYKTDVVPGIFRDHAVHYRGPLGNRSQDRSKTYKGFATAMAVQWTNYLTGTKHEIKKVWEKL